MPSEGDKSLDVLGIKPVAEAAKIVTQGSMTAAGKFLNAICMPAAEEFGQHLKDYVSGWRASRAQKLVLDAKHKTDGRSGDGLHANPRIVAEILDKGSWQDDDLVLSQWSGLLAASCVAGSPTDDNVIFVNTLSRMSAIQAQIINFAAERCPKFISTGGFAIPQAFETDLSRLAKELGGNREEYVIDAALDGLVALGLLIPESSALSDTKRMDLGLTGFGISFYVRCQGFVGPPSEYFNDAPDEATYKSQFQSTQTQV